jgi:erythromycin esterase-like protein
MIDELRLSVEPLTDGEAGDYDALLKLIGEARIVLLGVSSLGTHELFRAHAELTTRLIRDKGFVAMALPADSRAVHRLNSFVQGRTQDGLAVGALGDLTSFPHWMWRNAEMLDFLGWLRNYNDQFSGEVHKVCVERTDIESPRKTVVWDHSRYVGDARATGQPVPSLGQLARERHGPKAVLVGFGTCSGTTIAAAGQGRPACRQLLRPAPADSVEALCRALEIPRFYLPLRGIAEHLAEALRAPRLERMVEALFGEDDGGDTYVRARLADQFDALIYFDETRSLEPLDPG